MNFADVVILVVVGLFAVGGMRRGFLLGLVDLVVFGLSIIVTAHLARPVGEALRERGIPLELANGAGLVIVGVVSFAVIGLAARVLHLALVHRLDGRMVCLGSCLELSVASPLRRSWCCWCRRFPQKSSNEILYRDLSLLDPSWT